MTASEMPSRIPMPCPFAAGTGAALTPIAQSDGDRVNFRQGFPSIYGAPASGGGKYITRGEMNAIGNLASNDLFYHKCGGLNTFDPEFATAIGGYPEGAILQYRNNGYLYDVVSLRNNNTTNFITVGIDGVSWDYLSVPEKKLFDDVFFDGGYNVIPGNTILAVVRAKKTAGLSIYSSLEAEVSSEQSQSSITTAGNHGFVGYSLAIKHLGTSLPTESVSFPEITSSTTTFTPQWKGWSNLAGNYSAWGVVSTGGSGTRWDIESLASDNESTHGGGGALSVVIQDNYYAIGLLYGSATYNITSYYINWNAALKFNGHVQIMYGT